MDENEKGLYQKYIITKTNGKPLDPNFYAIVLRVDGGRYVDACRNAVLAFAAYVRPQNHKLASDLNEKILELVKEEVKRRMEADDE